MHSLLESLRPPSRCEPHRAELLAYIEAQLGEGDHRERFEAVARHLDQCIACAELYAMQYEAMLVSHTPVSDLGFLQQPPSLLQLLRQQVEQTAERVRLQLSEPLRQQLVPLPLTSAATVRQGEERYSELLLELTEAQMAHVAPGLPISVHIYRDNRNRDQALVSVALNHPQKSWPELAGYPVTLTGERFSEVKSTDPHGEVSFLEVPMNELDHLSILIDAPTT